MTGEASLLISGDALKACALTYAKHLRAKIEAEQGGLPSVFDSWFTRVVTHLLRLDPARSWEESMREEAARSPTPAGQASQWDLMRLRLFLDRWAQGRFVEFAQRERSAVHYHPRFGTEFGVDVLLTCQGAPSLMRWRGLPLMKNAFDLGIYPMLLGELRPLSVFEVGSGSGASAIWFADTLAALGLSARVHSVDLVKVQVEHPVATFHQGDCSNPEELFLPDVLRSAPHPWLVVEDAHHNVEAVLEHFHKFLVPGDYLVVEDSDVKRDTLRKFVGTHPGNYLVDTRFTDFFGRNATCAADSIFVRVEPGAASPPMSS